MRGLKKAASDGANKQTNRQTDGHCHSMTKSAQWGRFSEKIMSSSSPVVGLSYCLHEATLTVLLLSVPYTEQNSLEVVTHKVFFLGSSTSTDPI